MIHKMVDVLIKHSGVKTKVTQDYFDKYSLEGILIEVHPEPKFAEPEMLIVETPKEAVQKLATKPKAKVVAKE